MSKADQNITDLFNYSFAHADGFTKNQACSDLEISGREFNDAVTGLRHIFAGDTTTLICTPNGSREQWTYRLTDVMDDAEYWVDNRMQDTRARIRSIRSVTASLVKATDGRTRQGRMAREMNLTARQLVERLEMIEETA